MENTQFLLIPFPQLLILARLPLAVTSASQLPLVLHQSFRFPADAA